MINRSSIIIKNKTFTLEQKSNIIKKIRNIISGYDINFIEHPSFSKLEIVTPDPYITKQLGEVINVSECV